MTNSKSKTKEAKPASTIKKVIQKQITEESVTLRAEEPKVRYLKLYPFHRQRKYSYNTIVPELRLCGNWLQAAGFLPENYVSVTVMNGLLVIRSAHEHPAR
ncbi:MAG: type I toxin-antitoxin system SymE family toxin [Prevotellaceae bacterium]|nr:type I toxin-antitoxin system SymE family toxin [Prevotellaceae bacterium]